jgi:hypothetical protein
MGKSEKEKKVKVQKSNRFNLESSKSEKPSKKVEKSSKKV